MRKPHIIALLTAPLLLAAQEGTGPATEQRIERSLNPGASAHREAPGLRSDATSLWSEEFESGLNGWTVATEYGDVDWSLTANGNTGGFTPGPLESSTGYPGGHWIVADSDAEGHDGEPENTTITSPAILGFDTVRYMLLRFEQSFRQLNDDQTLVEVSGDGGADWTVYPVNEDVGGNQTTPGAPDAQVLVVNISTALAESSSDIRIRFRWISDQGFTYSWQVDDVALLAVRPHDLTLLQADHAAWDLEDMGYIGMPCTIYPIGETHELRFRGLIGNNGSEPQTGVHMRVQVTGPDGYETTLNSASITLDPGEMDSLFITDYELPDVAGNYVFHINALQDGPDDAPEDNMTEQSARVDAVLFARDEGHLEGVRANNGNDHELGNRFWIQEYGRLAEAVDVALGPGTEVGSVISAKLYDGNFNYIAQSDLHVVTQAEINGFGGTDFITLPFWSPTELDGERLYLACVYVQTSDGEAFTGISGTSPAQTSMIYRYETDHWYYITSTPMVRLRLVQPVGISDPAAAPLAIHVYPSPFSEGTTVMLNNAQSGDMAWSLVDASGRLVRQARTGMRPAGDDRIFVDGHGLDAGMYTLLIERGGERSILKLVCEPQR